MGKPKEKPKVTLPKPDEVVEAKPLVDKLAKVKARLAKVRAAQGADAKASDPKHRAAKKRVKRAQRRLRERLEYAATRRPKPKADGGAEAPASA
jgi:hypothetical protein